MMRQALVRESTPTLGHAPPRAGAATLACGEGASSNGEPAKKTDVAEHPEVFDHVGLLFNKPTSDTGMLFV
jgi:hypothetical protein